MKTLEETIKLINNIALESSLPREVTDDANRIASHIIELKIIGKLSPTVVALASLVLACRFNNIGIGLRQLLKFVREDSHKLKSISRRAYKLSRLYLEVYRPKASVSSYESYVRTASIWLSIPEDCKSIALQLARLFGEKYSRRLKPMAVAGASIYVAMSVCGKHKITIEKLSQTLKVTSPTLRTAIKLIKGLARDIGLSVGS
ncbi:MAG: hypothetical protein QW208_06425 [Acidilobaceae archaeon]